MKHVDILIIGLLCASASAAWSPFKPNKPVSRPTHHIHVGIEIDPTTFNPGELLDPKTPKSDIYMLARAGLQSIGKESSCHRVAAKLYMTNCQLLEDFESLDDGRLASQVGDGLQDYIDSFAASLAICDLQAAHADVAESCELFREPALKSSNGGRSLHASHEQIGQCMKGLHSNQNSWTSFNSNKDTATLLCRVARTDIERDNFISKLLTMANILAETDLAEERRRRDRVEEELATKLHLQKLHEHAADVTNGVLGIWDKISDKSVDIAKNLMEALRSASGNIEATNVAMLKILNSLVEGNAEHALAQQDAVAATSDLAIIARNANVAALDFRQLMLEVNFNITAMATALAAMEQRHAEAMDEQVVQVQVLVKNIREDLHRAKNVIMEMKDNTENIANHISKWAFEMLPIGPWGISWPFLLTIPTLTVILGGLGIPASYTGNISLFITGVLVAKLLSLAMDTHWQIDTPSVSALTHLARDKLSSTVRNKPVVFQAGTSTIDLTVESPHLLEII